MKFSTGHDHGYAIQICRIFLISILYCSVIVFLPAPALHAADQNALPVDIVSDKMEASQNLSMVEFTGHVTARQEDMEIRADSIQIFFTPEPSSRKADTSEKKEKLPSKKAPAADRQIQKIISTGHVQCKAGNRLAFADKAVYMVSNHTMTMTGSPIKLMEGKNQILGEKLTLFIDQNRAVMESMTETRVRASFSSEKSVEKSGSLSGPGT